LFVEALAHEIGHSFGAEHVFAGRGTDEEDREEPETFVKIEGSFIPDDFSGSDMQSHKYYYSGRKYSNLMHKLIMNGVFFKNSNGNFDNYRDLSFGTIYGFDRDGEQDPFILGHYEAGFFNSPEKPRQPQSCGIKQ